MPSLKHVGLILLVWLGIDTFPIWPPASQIDELGDDSSSLILQLCCCNENSLTYVKFSAGTHQIELDQLDSLGANLWATFSRREPTDFACLIDWP